MRFPALLAMIGFAAAAQAAPQRLTEAAARAFVARQDAAWNAGDLRAFAETFTPDARFVDQARGSDNRIVPYGASSLAEAVAQARRVFARSRVRQTSAVDRVEIAPDGAAARVLGREVSVIDTPGRPPRRSCAETEQVLVLSGGRIRSRGQTETAVRCRREG